VNTLSSRVSELPRIEEARLIRWTIVIHPADNASFHISEIVIFRSPPCGFALANYKSAISCGRYLTPYSSHSSSRVDIARFCRFAIARTMTKSRGSGSVCSFALMCLQWLVRFAALQRGVHIRVTYSRGNWRNWWIMVPRHAGYSEAMFRFASRQRYLRIRDSDSHSQDYISVNRMVTWARILEFCP